MTEVSAPTRPAPTFNRTWITRWIWRRSSARRGSAAWLPASPRLRVYWDWLGERCDRVPKSRVALELPLIEARRLVGTL